MTYIFSCEVLLNTGYAYNYVPCEFDAKFIVFYNWGGRYECKRHKNINKESFLKCEQLKKSLTI